VSRLRVGCIGTGFIAGRHLRALAGFDDVDIVAVADAVPERATEVAAAHDARGYQDGLQLLAEEDLDALWICVPPFAHGPLEEAAVQRGLPFLVEKPLAHDLDTASALAQRIDESGLLAAVGYHWRYLDAVQQAREIVAERPVALVNGAWLDATPPVAWWSVRQRSGGQVVEQTTHLLDLARLLVGEVAQVSAVEVAAPNAAQVPVASTATLNFASGAVGSISSARVLPGRHQVSLQLVGDGYVIELTERSLTDHEVRVVTADGEQRSDSQEDPIASEDRAFLDAVAGGSEPIRSAYSDALRSHALACAVDRSARIGAPVILDD